MFNLEQVKGVVERVATIAVAWAVGRGYVPEAVSADVIAVVVLALSVLWGWKVNTPASLDAASDAVKD